jgi:hypothetical protein
MLYAQRARAIAGKMLAHLTGADNYPAIHEIIASGDFDDEGHPDTDFDYGVARILDGIESLIQTSRPGKPRRRS